MHFLTDIISFNVQHNPNYKKYSSSSMDDKDKFQIFISLKTTQLKMEWNLGPSEYKVPTVCIASH